MAGRLRKWEAGFIQPRRQPTPCPLPRKDSGLTVRLRTITGTRIRSSKTGVRTCLKTPGTLSKTKQGAAPLHLYFARVPRTRALPCTECTDPCERARILQGFRAAAARAVYGGQEKAPPSEAEAASHAPYIYFGRVPRTRALPCTECTDSAWPLCGRPTSGLREPMRKRRPQRSWRPSRERLRVISSAYSRWPPTGRPCARRVRRMPWGLTRRAR